MNCFITHYTVFLFNSKKIFTQCPLPTLYITMVLELDEELVVLLERGLYAHRCRRSS